MYCGQELWSCVLWSWHHLSRSHAFRLGKTKQVERPGFARFWLMFLSQSWIVIFRPDLQAQSTYVDFHSSTSKKPPKQRDRPLPSRSLQWILRMTSAHENRFLLPPVCSLSSSPCPCICNRRNWWKFSPPHLWAETWLEPTQKRLKIQPSEYNKKKSQQETGLANGGKKQMS